MQRSATTPHHPLEVFIPLAAAAAMLAACGSSGPAEKPDPPPTGGGEATGGGGGGEATGGGGEAASGEGGSEASDPTAGEAVGGDGQTVEVMNRPAGAVGVTHMSWNTEGHLHVGFEGGRVALLDLVKGSAVVKRTGEVVAPVISVDPTGTMAVVKSDPGQLIRLKDGKVVLRMNDVEAIESATFSADGFSFLVAEPSGAMHAWNKGEELPTLPDMTVPKFLERQSADYTASFPSIKGPILTTPANRLIFGSAEGEIFWWNTDNYKEIEQLYKLPAEVQSVAYVEPFVATTSVKGDFKIGNQKEGVYLPWGRRVKADYVTATALLPEDVITLRGGELVRRGAADGEVRWETSFPSEGACGLAVSPGAKVVAACVDDVITMVYVKDAKARFSFALVGEEIKWVNAGGE